MFPTQRAGGAGINSPFVPYVPRLALSLADPGGPVAHVIDGSLLFVDVAGFTALSERLAKIGRGGAEEVTDVIDATFARLLSAAYEDGGSLLKFGGDALLIFFEGPDHTLRAAHAAGSMRRRPAELGSIVTSIGPVRLRVSMGLHTGRFVFMIVGEQARELVVTGPAVSTTVRLEKAASAGEIVISAECAAQLPATVTGRRLDGHFVIRRTPRPSLRRHEGGDPSASNADTFLPGWLQDHVLGDQTPEHRRLAVGFIQFTGLDGMIETEGVDRATTAVHDLVSRFQKSADRYTVSLLGSDVDADGGKLFAVAGAPKATERHEERLIRVFADVLSTAFPLTLRAGITSGPVFVGDVGPPYRRTFTAMGDQVNLAARLMAHAEAGQLVVSGEAVRGCPQDTQVSALEPFHVKGKKDLLQAFVVRGVGSTESPEPEHRELLGRARERAVLDTAVADCRSGRASLIELVGPPGVGKSRLAQAFLNSARELKALRVTAQPYEQSRPYSAAACLLRAALGVGADSTGDALATRLREVTDGADGWSDEAYELLLLVLGSDHFAAPAPRAASVGVSATAVQEDERRRARLHRAVLRLLQRTIVGPHVALLEDLHWCDQSSLELFAYLLRDGKALPWCVVATRRPGGRSLVSPRSGFGTLLPLEGLDDATAFALIEQAVAHAPLPASVIRQLVAKAGGNPLFLTELAKSVDDSNFDGGIPDSVEAVINARLDALPRPARRLLREASVLGMEFDFAVLRELASDEPDATLRAELGEFLVVSESGCRFSHSLFREVAYETLPFKGRRAMHLRALQVFEHRSADVELLSLHAHNARDLSKAWTYGLQAARRAAARSAHADAAVAFQQALDAFTEGHLPFRDEAFQAYQELGNSLYRSGRFTEATRAFRRARHLSPHGAWGDPDLLILEGRLRMDLGRFPEALSWFTRGEHAVRSVSTNVLEKQALVDIGRASTRFRQGRYRDCIELCHRVIRSSSSTSEAVLAHAYYLLHLALTTIDSPERLLYRDKALPIYERLHDLGGQARVLNNQGVDAYYEGRWSDALELWERSGTLDEQDGETVGKAVSTNNIAEILSDQGHFDRARSIFRESSQVFRTAEDRVGSLLVLSNLGRLEARAGNYRESERLLTQALEGFSDIGATGMTPDVRLRLAELALYSGDHTSIQGRLDGLAEGELQGAEQQSSAALLGALAAAVRGDPEGALAQADAAIALAGHTALYTSGMAHRVLGILLGPEEGAEPLRQSNLLLRQLGVVQFRSVLEGNSLVSLVGSVVPAQQPSA